MRFLRKKYFLYCCVYVFGLLSFYLLRNISGSAGDFYWSAHNYISKLKPKTYDIRMRKGLRSDKFNVVLISIDAMRHDRLNQDLSPFLWRFASEGQFFENAFTVFPGTPPSFASLMTSRLPHFKGLRLAHNGQSHLFGLSRFYNENDDRIGLPRSMKTMAEIFHNNGYITMGIVTNPYLGKEFHFDKGFDLYETFEKFKYRPYPKADDVISTATRMLKKVGHHNFFLWTHFMDVHQPYQSSPAAKQAVSHVNMNYPHQDIDINFLNYIVPVEQRPFRFSHEWQADFVASRNLEYNSAVYNLDQKIEQFIERIKKLNLYENTIFIILADHGEELADHGLLGHKLTLYEELVRIPFIIHCPKLIRPKKQDALVRNVDLLPTLIDVLDLREAPEKMDGVSLKPLLMGTAEDLNNRVYMTAVFRTAIRDREWKLIRNDQTNVSTAFELYNLIKDPLERENVYCDHPEKAEELLLFMNRIDVVLDKEGSGQVKDRRRRNMITIKEETKEKLRSLGYIH